MDMIYQDRRQMKKNIMKKWVKALRSGEYDQGTGCLAQEDESGNHQFCCLGVLCNIMQEETGELKIGNYQSGLTNAYVYSYDDEVGVLENKVMEWSGIKDNNGAFKYKNNHSVDLASLNDKGKTFEEIADIIEKNYEVI